MKNKSIVAGVMALMMALSMAGCAGNTSDHVSEDEVQSQSESATASLYLYGESHGQEAILEKELELWYQYYHKEGMRHLFVELPYYTAEFLNLWMEADDDEILEAVYEESKGTAAYVPCVKEFYKKIKEQCPETIFHGTDVGHQYGTTGKRFLNYLQENHLEDSKQYQIAQDVIEQGKNYYEHRDGAYRENKMAENFIRAFEELEGENIMGIYGSAHIGIEAMDYDTQSVPSMANQLYAVYGDALHTEDLTWVKKEMEPERVDRMTVGGKEYEACYFGKEDLTGFKDFAYREFWRLENAYDDFKDCPKVGDVLPYSNYPMLIENGQVFVVELAKTDGSALKLYYRSDGNSWQGSPTTEGFSVDKEY